MVCEEMTASASMRDAVAKPGAAGPRATLVSAIVPTHNRAELILCALDSVWSQTYRPIELIVVDDGSTDRTEALVEAWAREHHESEGFRCRYVRQENGGANSARNRGIRESRGDFVAFLDSDDRCLRWKLEMQMPVFRRDQEIGGVYCGLRQVNLDTGGSMPGAPRGYPSGWLLRALLMRDVTGPTSCYVVRKDCFERVGAFDESLPARQDWDMWIRLSAEYKIGCVPEVLVEQGEHCGERVRSNPAREVEAHQAIFRKYASLRAGFPLWVSQAARGAMYRRRGRVYFHRGESGARAALMYVLAITNWPFCFDSYAALGGVVLPKSLRLRLHVAWNRIFGRTFLGIHSH